MNRRSNKLNDMSIERESPIKNALTVDLEDYFHVSAFAGVLDRGAWPSLQSRGGPEMQLPELLQKSLLVHSCPSSQLLPKDSN